MGKKGSEQLQLVMENREEQAPVQPLQRLRPFGSHQLHTYAFSPSFSDQLREKWASLFVHPSEAYVQG